MKVITDKLNLAGVIRIKEQQEEFKKHEVDAGMKESFRNLHIALLWCITQE